MDPNKSKLNILFWNANGIRNKIEEFYHFISENNTHIACINETFLKDCQNLYTHPDYKIYRYDRADRPKGGVAIIIKKDLNHELLPAYPTNILECIGVKVCVNDNIQLHIISAYLPGGSSTADIRAHLAEDIRKLTSSHRNTFICGDLNARHRFWSCSRANTAGTILYEEFCASDFMIHHPDTPTYYPSDPNKGTSTIDLMLSKSNLETTRLKTTNLSSDHCAVIFQIKTSRLVKRDIQELRPDFSNADWDKYRGLIHYHIGNRSFEVPTTKEEIDNHIDKFTRLLEFARDKSVKKVQQNKYSIKLTDEIIQLIEEKNDLRRSWQRSRDPATKTRINQLNKEIRQGIDTIRNENWNRKLSHIKPSNQSLWKTAKLCKSRNQVLPPLIKNGATYITNSEKANIIGETFRDNHRNPLEQLQPGHTLNVNRTVQDFIQQDGLECDIELAEEEEIREIITKLKNPKAPGFDRINNMLIKKLPARGIEYLRTIVNACLSLHYFPETWKHAKVISLLKPGKPANAPSSYRPISLLSSLSKILERVILNRINAHIQDNNILPDEQCGFRAKRSTAHQLIRVLQTAKEKLNQKESTGLIFLDVEKAFDRVWHNGLIYKMIKLNFSPTIIKLINSFLTNRFFSVFISGKFSEKHPIEHGVPQGAVLSPTLYNIYTHDITQDIPSEIALFADDTALYHSSKSSSAIKTTLRRAGVKIQQYMEKWKISLNKQKTQAIFVTRRRSRELPGTAINIFNERIRWEDQCKYLGMIIDKRVTFKKHIEYVTQRSNTALRLLYPMINRNSLLDVRNKLLIYKLAIRPVFTYGCPAYQGIAKTHIRQLQILQNKFLRIILNRTRFDRIDDLHEEAKIPRVDEYITKLQDNFNQRLLN